MSEITKRADASIRNHVGFAMTAAIVPVPVADIGAITLVEMDMLRSLTKIYGFDWKDGLATKAVAIAAAIAAGTGLWASALKFIPGFGSIAGGAIQMGIAGSVCYALGKTYSKHLESGGELFDAATFKAEMKEHLKQGKKIAKDLKEDVKKGKYEK